MNPPRDSTQKSPSAAIPDGLSHTGDLPGDLRWWRRITVPFEVLIASVVVTAMLLLTGLMAYQVGTSAQQAILSASDDSAYNMSQLIAERVNRIVEPADAAIRLLAFDPVATAPTLAIRLRRLPLLTRLLEQNQLISAVFIGYADGQFLLVRPLRNEAMRERLEAPQGAAYVVQSVARENGDVDMVGRWSHYDADLHLIDTSVRPEYRYDPGVAPGTLTPKRKTLRFLPRPMCSLPLKKWESR
ncbi:hypothetical protein [Ottowia caeni]|uniref:hypothetical protein n=1 Tax=Ottowia caeni TaxID=2870339 RepID=UPI003D7404A3